MFYFHFLLYKVGKQLNNFYELHTKIWREKKSTVFSTMHKMALYITTARQRLTILYCIKSQITFIISLFSNCLSFFLNLGNVALCEQKQQK